MKIINFFLSYNCYPIWVYDEFNKLIYNGENFTNISHENQKKLFFLDESLLKICDEIQKLHDSMFTNNENLFEYNEDLKVVNQLKELLNKVVEILSESIGNEYLIKIE